MSIAIFYHVYQAAGWRRIYDEQIDLLKSSGLADISKTIHIGVTGDKNVAKPFKNSVIAKNNPDLWEGPTLMAVKDFCDTNEFFKILYFHTKGVTNPSKPMTSWRHMMEYFCIERWRDCVNRLDEFDTVGCNFSEETFNGLHPHFSGNFWWARSDYIKTCNIDFLYSSNRVDQECWIGSGNGSMLDVYNPECDLKFFEHPRKMYEGTVF